MKRLKLGRRTWDVSLLSGTPCVRHLAAAVKELELRAASTSLESFKFVRQDTDFDIVGAIGEDKVRKA